LRENTQCNASDPDNGQEKAAESYLSADLREGSRLDSFRGEEGANMIGGGLRPIDTWDTQPVYSQTKKLRMRGKKNENRRMNL